MGRKASRWYALNLVLAGLVLSSNILFGFPADWVIQELNNARIVDKLYLAMHDSKVVDEARAGAPRLPAAVGRVSAANFSIRTGYYIGDSTGSHTVSGLGFQPQSVVIKANTAAGSGVWKSKDMAVSNTAFLAASANDTSTMVTLAADGFTVNANANVNTANVRYVWVAFAGSDCTSSGTVCMGTYSGNGASPRLITTGFQPAFVMVKRSTAVGANFRTSSMGPNVGNYFTTTAQDTSGVLFTTLASNGFNVGSTDNTSGGTYYYMAFKAVSGVMAVGTYTGNSTDNTSITGFGAGSVPSFAFVKNVTNATASNRNAVMNLTSSYGDSSSYMSAATANLVNAIQGLQSDGFQVGTAAQVNNTGDTFYWAGFGGETAEPTGSGTFTMAVGSYAGTGAAQSVTGLGFKPDLVLIKDNAANQSVFRTSLMMSDNTAYLANAAADFTGGITSLDPDGFTVGTSTVANASGSTYQWQAFGNAYNTSVPASSQASDFMIGAYYGSGADNREITGLTGQPDLVAVKRNSSTAGSWRSSATTGDVSSFFAATAESANRIQSLDSFGFQVGTAANVNSSGSPYNWFAFKNGKNFTEGSYTGTGSVQNITSAGFQPDLVWIKRSTAVAGVSRSSSLSGDATQYFTAAANAAGRITGLVCNGFSLGGAQTETNTSASTYRYAAWRVPTAILSADIVDGSGCAVGSPSISLSAASVGFSCTTTTGTLGVAGQRVRVTNTTGNPGWNLSIAATNGSTALWQYNSARFDFNDSSGSPPGCSAGVDSDVYAGQLSLGFGSATITPQSGCSTTGVSLGSDAGFQEGVTDTITLATASSSAATGCYWDIQGIGLSQRVPASQPPGTYALGMTVTLVAQ